MSLTFRKATAEDIPLINRLACKIWREHYPDIISHEQIEFMLSDRYSEKALAEGMQRGEQFFLAYANDEPLGYAGIGWKDGYYYLHKFYIDVSKHRGGVGSGLFNYLLSNIDASKPIRLQVNRTNYKAINFYFKNGFVIEKVGDFDIGGGFFMNDFVMIRK